MSQLCLAGRIVPPPIVPQFLPLSVLAGHSCMDRAIELHYLVSGNNQFGQVNRTRTLDLIRTLKFSYDLDAPRL